MKATHVVFDGPFPDIDGDEEFPTWHVAVCADDGEPLSDGHSWTCFDYDFAKDFAGSVAKKHGVELVSEAMAS